MRCTNYHPIDKDEMKLFSDKITSENLRSIAESMGIEIYNLTDEGVRVRGKNKGKRVMRFVLKPGDSEEYRLIRNNPYSKTGTRRVWAVSWRGHWDFMLKVFTIDPEARIESAIATYQGIIGFMENAPATRHKNTGSQIYPQEYGTADIYGGAFSNV